MTTDLERGCVECGLRMSDKRRTILRIIEEAKDHPSAEEVYRRALFLGQRISVATVYRNMALLSRVGLLTRLELGDRKAHYEKAHPEPHEHLIDVKTGRNRGVLGPEDRRSAEQRGRRARLSPDQPSCNLVLFAEGGNRKIDLQQLASCAPGEVKSVTGWRVFGSSIHFPRRRSL